MENAIAIFLICIYGAAGYLCYMKRLYISSAAILLCLVQALLVIYFTNSFEDMSLQAIFLGLLFLIYSTIIKFKPNIYKRMVARDTEYSLLRARRIIYIIIVVASIMASVDIYNSIISGNFISAIRLQKSSEGESSLIYSIQILKYLTYVSWAFALFADTVNSRQLRSFFNMGLLSSLIYGVATLSKANAILFCLASMLLSYSIHRHGLSKWMLWTIYSLGIFAITLITSLYNENSDIAAELIQRATTAQVEGYPVAIKLYNGSPDLFMSEIGRICSHFGLCAKNPLVSEYVFNEISGVENLFGNTGLSSSITIYGYAYASLGYFFSVFYFMYIIAIWMTEYALHVKKISFYLRIAAAISIMPIVFVVPSNGTMFLPAETLLLDTIITSMLFLTIARVAKIKSQQ